jgi:PST family polysaccharide transporter
MSPEGTDAHRGRLSRRAVAGFGWAYGSFVGGKLFAFVATLVLARLLVPEQFGLVSFALAVIAYLDNVTDLGMGSALIYRSDAKDPRVASSAFWIGIAGALVLVVGCVLLAPVAGDLGPGPDIVPVLQLLSLHILLRSLGHVHEYLLRRELGFKSMLAPQLGSGFVKGAVSIALALAGFGVWSLVAGQLAGTATRTVLLWLVYPWRPRLAFSREATRSMLRYGLGISAVGILGEASKNLDFIIVGATLGSTALGFYYIAFRLPELLVMSGSRVGQQVLFPFYSRLGDVSGPGGDAHRRELTDGYHRTLRLAALVFFPAGLGMAALASPLVLTLYGERWEASVLPLALIAVWAAVSALYAMPGALFKAMGRSGLLTATSVLEVAILAPALWLSAPYGIAAVAGAQVAAKILNFILLSMVLGRVLRTSWIRPVAGLVPAIALASVMGAAVLGIALVLPPLPALLVGGPLGLVLYLGLMRAVLPADFRMVSAQASALRGRRRRRTAPEEAPAPVP